MLGSTSQVFNGFGAVVSLMAVPVLKGTLEIEPKLLGPRLAGAHDRPDSVIPQKRIDIGD